MKKPRINFKAVAVATTFVVSIIVTPLSLVGCGGASGPGGSSVVNSKLKVGESKSDTGVKVIVVDADKSTNGTTKVTVPEGAKSFVLAGSGANAKFADATVTLTSPDGNSHAKITLHNGSVSQVEGGNTLQSEADLQTKDNVVMPGSSSDATSDQGCSAGNGGCLVDFASVMVGKPQAGDWNLEVQTGAVPTTMTIAVVGNAIQSVSQVQNLTVDAGNAAGVSITTRGGCNWFVRATINTVCQIALRVGIAVILILMYEYGLGWIIARIGPTLLRALINQGVKLGCNWFTDQVCARI